MASGGEPKRRMGGSGEGRRSGEKEHQQHQEDIIRKNGGTRSAESEAVHATKMEQRRGDKTGQSLSGEQAQPHVAKTKKEME